MTPTRRVVTGIVDGIDVLQSDGPAPNSLDIGPVAVSEVWWSERSHRTVGDPCDRTTPGFPLEPPPGGASARIIRMPGIPDGADLDSTWLRVDGDDPSTPGMHATDTLDFMVVLDGSVVLGLDDGERVIGPGEYVVQRGTRHRWRPADEHGWTYFVAMLRPDPTVTPVDGSAREHNNGDAPVRRVITGAPVLDGGAEVHLTNGGFTMTDVWHTGGPLRRATQGGDPDGPWALEPTAGGAWFRQWTLEPAPPSEAGWHRTRTIDLDIVLRGRVRLDLPGGITTEAGPGDVIVQRGTDHRWTALGDETLVVATVMFDAEW
ncbi:MAG: AraC family ligand binding domain-containing protein [Acidimicrobiia bacterium]